MMKMILDGVVVFIDVLCWLILMNSVLSWIVPGSKAHRATSRLVEPMLMPFRAFTQKLMRGPARIDFSPSFAILTGLILTAILTGISTGL